MNHKTIDKQTADSQALESAFVQVKNRYQAAQSHLKRIEQTMAALKAAGMYPALPTEQWQPRNGSEPIYLYMIFAYDARSGSYAGPGGKRKLYVGNKPDRIADARRLAKNRASWETLDSVQRQLTNWLIRCKRDLLQWEMQHRGHPWVDIDQLGPTGGGAEAVRSPNGAREG